MWIEAATSVDRPVKGYDVDPERCFTCEVRWREDIAFAEEIMVLADVWYQFCALELKD